MSKTVIVNVIPPMMKVNGELIKTLMEVDSSTTVKKRLNEWSIPTKNGYVITENILDYLSKPEIVLDSYKPLTSEANSI